MFVIDDRNQQILDHLKDIMTNYDAVMPVAEHHEITAVCACFVLDIPIQEERDDSDDFMEDDEWEGDENDDVIFIGD